MQTFTGKTYTATQDCEVCLTKGSAWAHRLPLKLNSWVPLKEGEILIDTEVFSIEIKVA